MPQDQFLRQDVVAQQDFEVLGNTQLGNGAGDITTVVGKMVIGGTTVQPVANTFYGPGPLTNEVIFSFAAATYDAAQVTVTVADDVNSDVYAASFTIAHDGTTPILSSAYGEADAWGGTNPTFNVNNNAGTIEFRMSLADAVSAGVAVDAKLFSAQTSPQITFTVPPTNESVTAPAPATFNLTAITNDTGTLTYQWEVDDGLGGGFVNATGGVYSGDTTDTLTVTDSTGLNGYNFRCVVTSSATASPATSVTVSLTVA